MHFHNAQSLHEGEHAEAMQLALALSRLWRSWMAYEPRPPLRRSNMPVLGAMMHFNALGQKEVTPGYLARELHQSQPAISQKVGELEDIGLLKRTAGVKDRREVKIALTDKGIETAYQSMDGFLHYVDRALEKLGRQKTASFIQLTEEFGDVVDAVKNSAIENANNEGSVPI